MSNLPTASEVVEDLRKYPELRKLLSRQAQWGLIEMAEQENEKANCGEQSA